MAMDRSDYNKIAIIGMGHLGKAVYKGLINSGYDKINIFSSNCQENNINIIREAYQIIIAVKPMRVGEVLTGIRKFSEDKIIISAAAGVNIAFMRKAFPNQKQKIIRIMPNIPIACNQGIIGFFANQYVTKYERASAKLLLSRLGFVIPLKKEQELDDLTILSGCGPAIVCTFINMISNTSQSINITKKQRDLLAINIFAGTIHYMSQTGLSPNSLIKKVATKGGITEAILHEMVKNNIYSEFQKSIIIGKNKIKSLHQILTKPE